MRTNDARSLDHATLEAMRERAVRSVQNGESPEVVARVIGVNRSTMYGWLAQYRRGGWRALKAKPLFGRPPKLTRREKADIYIGDAAHMRSDHHSGRTWGKKGETPVVLRTGARYGMSLISAVTSRGHMRFMIKEKGGVNAEVFIEFLRRLMIGSKNKIFLIVDRGPAHVAKKTKTFVASLTGRLRLFYLPPYSPDRNPDELVWKHLKADTVGRALITSFRDFKEKVRSSMLSLQRNPAKIRAFFQKPSLRYAA